MQAVILCGGKGERLSPFTNNCPKGMIKIEGKPILEYQIEWLKKYGVNKIIFACGYLHEKIKEYFGDGSKFGLEIGYSIEEEPLGRGGAIKKAWDYIVLSTQHPALSTQPVVVTNGDIYTQMDLSQAIVEHKKQREKRNIIATICLFPYKSPYGIVRLNTDNLVDSFDEKRALPYWVNGGIYIFEDKIKDYLPNNGDHETSTFVELAKRKSMFGYKSYDYWKGIDTVRDLNEFVIDTKALQLVK